MLYMNWRDVAVFAIFVAAYCFLRWLGKAYAKPAVLIETESGLKVHAETAADARRMLEFLKENPLD